MINILNQKTESEKLTQTQLAVDKIIKESANDFLRCLIACGKRHRDTDRYKSDLNNKLYPSGGPRRFNNGNDCYLGYVGGSLCAYKNRQHLHRQLGIDWERYHTAVSATSRKKLYITTCNPSWCCRMNLPESIYTDFESIIIKINHQTVKCCLTPLDFVILSQSIMSIIYRLTNFVQGLRLFGATLNSLCFFIIMPVHSVEGYDSYYACRFRNNSDWIFLECPRWTHDARVPAFCCGTTEEKTCCEWSIYVINFIGGGYTNIGFGVFVGLLIMAAYGVFCICCGVFRIFCVGAWNRASQRNSEQHRSRLNRNDESRLTLVRVPSNIAV